MTILSALVSILGFRIRSRASLELELISLRHQVSVLRRQHKGRIRLFSTDRLLWVPGLASGQDFRLYWRWRARRLGRPKMSAEIRDLIHPPGLSPTEICSWENCCRPRLLVSLLNYRRRVAKGPAVNLHRLRGVPDAL
jgi:hypothetical protein